MTRFGGEPELDDILSDPIVLSMMRGDGVDAEALRALLRTIREARRRCGGGGDRASCAAL